MGDKPEERQFPQSLAAGLPLNVLAPEPLATAMEADQPEAIAALREASKRKRRTSVAASIASRMMPSCLWNHNSGQPAAGPGDLSPNSGQAGERVCTADGSACTRSRPTLLQAAGIQHAISCWRSTMRWCQPIVVPS